VNEEKIKDAILSSHIFKVDLNTDKILPKYLEALFRSTLGQIQFFRNNNGGIVPEISQSALKSLMVVIPSLEIQNRIVDEVKRRISETEGLKAEARKIIEEARKQVAEMILSG
jgi:restriction endonuclease S subunit